MAQDPQPTKSPNEIQAWIETQQHVVSMSHVLGFQAALICMEYRVAAAQRRDFCPSGAPPPPPSCAACCTRGKRHGLCRNRQQISRIHNRHTAPWQRHARRCRIPDICETSGAHMAWACGGRPVPRTGLRQANACQVSKCSAMVSVKQRALKTARVEELRLDPRWPASVRLRARHAGGSGHGAVLKRASARGLDVS